METTTQNLTRLKIDNTDVFLEDFEINQGKITISDTYGHNYSYYWGAMGGNLSDFICHINSQYFTDKLFGARKSYVIDVKKTCSALRKHISSEIILYYKEMEFQKDMRRVLRDFQEECEEAGSEEYFVDNFFRRFVDKLNFYLVKDEYTRKELESAFGNIDECWSFIETKPSNECIWLTKFHGKLKKEIKKCKENLLKIKN